MNAFEFATAIAAHLTGYTAEAHPKTEAKAILRSDDPTLPSLEINYDLVRGHARFDHKLRVKHHPLALVDYGYELFHYNPCSNEEHKINDTKDPKAIAKQLTSKVLPSLMFSHQEDLEWLTHWQKTIAERDAMEQAMRKVAQLQRASDQRELHVMDINAHTRLTVYGNLEVSTGDPEVAAALINSGAEFTVTSTISKPEHAVKFLTPLA